MAWHGSGLQVSEFGSHKKPEQQSPSLPQALLVVPHAWQLPVVAQIKPPQQVFPKALHPVPEVLHCRWQVPSAGALVPGVFATQLRPGQHCGRPA